MIHICMIHICMIHICMIHIIQNHTHVHNPEWLWKETFTVRKKVGRRSSDRKYTKQI